MKRNCFIIISLIIGFGTINAQKWKAIHVEADELLNRQEMDGMSYFTDNTSFTFYDGIDDDFILTSGSTFDYSTMGASGGHTVSGIVGIYDSEGKLIKKYGEYIFETINGVCYQLHSNKYSRMGGNNKKNAKKIINYIKNSNGVVRFVLPLYNSTINFDLRVECLGNTFVKFE